MGRPVDYDLIYSIEYRNDRAAREYTCPAIDGLRSIVGRMPSGTPVTGVTNGEVRTCDGKVIPCDEWSGEILVCGCCPHAWSLHRDDDGGGPITDETAFIYCKRCGCTGGFGR